MEQVSSPSLSPTPEPIPARMLNEFVYCPRLFYYEHVEAVFTHNADTLAGKSAHQRVDSGKGDLPPAQQASPDGSAATNGSADSEAAPPEIIHSRSVWLASDRLGVSAKMDLVEAERPAEADLFTTLRVCPVDYKVGSPREGAEGNELWDTDRMQLGLQALILRDNGYACDEAVVFYRGTRQRVRLEITPALEAWILERIGAARAAMVGTIPPPLTDSPKCPRCSLVSICLPDETRLLSLAPDSPSEEDELPPQQVAFSFDAEFPSSRLLTRGAMDDPAERLHRLPIVRPSRRLVAAADDKRPLYLNTPGLYVSRSSEVLITKDREGKTEKYRINDLHHVALFGSIGISTPAVQTLCEKDIPITYFSMGGWFYGLTRGHSLKNVFSRIEQFRQSDNPEACLRYARAFVHGKIRNQRTLLMRNHIEPPELALKRLKHAAGAVFLAESLDELLGIEGAAALTYFQNFAGMIKAGREPGEENGDTPETQLLFSFDFTKRNRRPPRDAVNALLSLGYSLLARDCTIAAYAVGFDPYVGFFHQPRFGRPALALDIMEEFRAIVVDSVVLTLLNNRVLSTKDFVRAGEAVNLSPAGRRIFFEYYEKRLSTIVTHPIFDYKVSYRRAIELQYRLLARALTGEISSYLPFTTR
jgi:CRISP-associated protein Cas1